MRTQQELDDWEKWELFKLDRPLPNFPFAVTIDTGASSGQAYIDHRAVTSHDAAALSAALNVKPGWVAVGEGLPEELERVLVLAWNGIQIAEYDTDTPGDDDWWQCELSLPGVTHWQPLPTPPASAEQKDNDK